MAAGDRSISGVLLDIVGDVQDIVRSEIRLARSEMTIEFDTANGTSHRKQEGDCAMGTTSNQIENYIDNQRENLGQNLRELETRVKSVADDWRYQFENHPTVFLGAAFGGGILLAAALRPSAARNRRGRYAAPVTAFSPSNARRSPRPPHENSPARETALHAWENIKGALVGVAAARLKDYVDEFIPGFSAQYRHVESRHRA